MGDQTATPNMGDPVFNSEALQKEVEKEVAHIRSFYLPEGEAIDSFSGDHHDVESKPHKNSELLEDTIFGPQSISRDIMPNHAPSPFIISNLNTFLNNSPSSSRQKGTKLQAQQQNGRGLFSEID